MTDMGVCERCGAGNDGVEIELNENGLCKECAAEEGHADDMGPVDMGDTEDADM